MLARAIAKHLAATVDGLTFDEHGTTGNVFVAWMPDQPDTAVMVMPEQGDEQPTKAPTDTPRIQIMTRGPAAAGPMVPYELAQAIEDQLACLDHTTLDPAGPDAVRVIGITPHQSGPVSIGQDANGRHEWTTNWRLRIHRPTAHRPAITA